MTNLRQPIEISPSLLGQYCLEFSHKTAEGVDLDSLEAWLKEHNKKEDAKNDEG